MLAIFSNGFNGVEWEIFYSKVSHTSFLIPITIAKFTLKISKNTMPFNICNKNLYSYSTTDKHVTVDRILLLRDNF